MVRHCNRTYFLEDDSAAAGLDLCQLDLTQGLGNIQDSIYSTHRGDHDALQHNTAFHIFLNMPNPIVASGANQHFAKFIHCTRIKQEFKNMITWGTSVACDQTS